MTYLNISDDVLILHPAILYTQSNLKNVLHVLHVFTTHRLITILLAL